MDAAEAVGIKKLSCYENEAALGATCTKIGNRTLSHTWRFCLQPCITSADSES